jgi:membrane fusion protein (multidrug efflux system)
VLANPDRALKPGMLLTVRVTAAAHDGMALPELAVIGDGADRYVYVVKDGKAARTPVKTGLHDGGLIEVTGLPTTAKVIVEGVVKVSDGARVRIAPAAKVDG